MPCPVSHRDAIFHIEKECLHCLPLTPIPRIRNRSERDLAAISHFLPAAKVAWSWNEDDPLIEAAKLNPKPAFLLAAHIGANRAGGDFAPM
jgi:hypothetical protein